MTREHRFGVGSQPKVSVRMPVGDVRVVAGAEGELLVHLDGSESAVARFIVEQRGDEVVIEPERSSHGWRSAVEVTIHVGSPADVSARLTAADLAVSVPVASLHVETASGNVVARDVAGDVTIRSASGDIRLGDIGGRLDAAAASGEVRAGRVGQAVTAKTASGDLYVEGAAGDVSAKSASGDVRVGTFTGSWLDIKTMSGDASIGVTSGRRFDVSFQTLSGDVRTDFPVTEGATDGGSARLGVKTISGDIEIHAAS